MYLLVIFLPFISFLTIALFGRYLGKQGSTLLATSLIFLSSFISIFIFYEVVLSHSVCTIKLFSWLDSNLLFVSWGFLFDSLTATMLIVVTIVSSLVHLYSTEYMSEDPHLPRFMSYLSLFTFFMLMLVTADNFVQMFLGWEGVGLASYLLINFWYTRIQANKSAMKALIINRIGDFGLSLGIAGAFYLFNTLDFTIIFSLTPTFINHYMIFFNWEIHSITLISILLFIGAVGKSAQIGLHTWLPDAMEGPTPVSALIHAATMVTAGVFVLLRCSPILEYSNTALMIITIIGALTAFMAATIGVVQNDLKKVIAYSTCSQLGYMVFSCGLSNYFVALFHLMNHAFFKALLFLSAGSVIHAISDEQDMRKMGGLLKILPVTYIMIFIGSLSLMGFPFLTGFYSKDVILELSFSNYTFDATFAYWLGTLSAFFTAFYSIRLIYLTFLTGNNSVRKDVEHVHEAPLAMMIPLIVLCFGSIFVGYIAKDLFLGVGVDTWNNSLYQKPENINIFEAEFLPATIKLIPVIFSLSGAFISLSFYTFFKSQISSLSYFYKYYYIYKFFIKKWYFDNIYNTYIAKSILSFGYKISFKTIDRGLIELIGPLGIVRSISKFSLYISKLESGLIYHYIFSMIIAIVFLILIFSFQLTLSLSLYPIYLFLFVYILYNLNNKKLN